MKIEVQGLGVTDGKMEPHVTVSKAEIEDRTPFGQTACRIDVEKETGELARFWVHVTMKNGRPRVTLTTKPDKYREKEVSKSVAGSFNVI